MTIAATIGDDFTTPILVKTVRNYDSSGFSVIETWKTKDGGSWRIGDQHPTHTTTYLSSFQSEEAKGMILVTLEYRQKTWSGSSAKTLPVVGTVIHGGDANALEVPIEQHPDYKTAWSTSKPGVTSYLSPQPVYTYEQVVNSFTWSESNIKSTVGQIIAPTEMTSPSAGKWLHVGRAVYEQGDAYLIRDTFQYAEKAWDTDIYTFVS